MSLLTAPIVATSHILTEIYFIFLKFTFIYLHYLSYTKLENLSIPNLDNSEKTGKVVNK